MTELTDTKELFNHQFHCTFLNGKFKVRVTSDANGKNLYWEWGPELPWELRMTPKTKRKFYAELNAFRISVLTDCRKIAEQSAILVELGGAA